MKKLIIYFVLLCSMLILSGCFECQRTTDVICYEKLTKEKFLELNVSDVISVEVVSTGAEVSQEPHKWRRIYTNVFPILDYERIEIIHGSIRDAEPFDYYTDRYILFTTKDRIYYLGIGWIHETAHGDWWISTELREHLREWGVRRDAEEPPRETIVDSPRKRGRGMDQRE